MAETISDSHKCRPSVCPNPLLPLEPRRRVGTSCQHQGGRLFCEGGRLFFAIVTVAHFPRRSVENQEDLAFYVTAYVCFCSKNKTKQKTVRGTEGWFDYVWKIWNCRAVTACEWRGRSTEGSWLSIILAASANQNATNNILREKPECGRHSWPASLCTVKERKTAGFRTWEYVMAQ